MRGPGALELTEVELRDPGPREVRVRIKACGVCQTDAAALSGKLPAPAPVVLGHEAAGVVEKIGSQVTGLAVGDLVVLTVVNHCGACERCRTGEPSVCPVGLRANASGALVSGPRAWRDSVGEVHHFFGVSGWAHRVVVYETSAVPIGVDLPADVACLLGCGAGTGLGAVLRAGLGPGAAVAVFGCGGVGLAAIMAAGLVGARAVVAVDLNAERLALAQEFGAVPIGADEPDVSRAVRRACGGGADLAVDTVAGNVTRTAARSLRPGGTLSLIGAGPAAIDALDLQPGKRLVSSVAGGLRPSIDIPRWAAMAAEGRLPLDSLVTRRRPLEEAATAVDDLAAARGIRTVLVNT
jgi:Zn-dependent alcohol dehydrogenase